MDTSALRIVGSVGIVGAGTMGTGIALACANAGLDTMLVDADAGALERALTVVRENYETQVARGRIPRDEAERRRSRIACSRDVERLAQADVAIEAVFEDAAIKREVFARLGSVCAAGAILATNTSSLDVDTIVGAAPHPERALGMHFFSPAHVMKLMEIVRGAATSPATLEAAVVFARRLGKIAVVVGNCDGFVGNRMLLGYKREAEFLVLRGAAPERVDSALERFGFAMGPFAVADLAGIDVGWRAKMERANRGASPKFALTELTDAFVAAGRLGQKSGAGYYAYETGRRERRADSDSDALVERERHRAGFAQREFADDEIVERCVYALVNEGARILGDGIAASASDVDTIWVNGYGFPRERGGPMRFAEDTGVPRVLAAIERFAREDPTFWAPAPLLVAAARRGSFAVS